MMANRDERSERAQHQEKESTSAAKNASAIWKELYAEISKQVNSKE